jgi:hypothetical protein
MYIGIDCSKSTFEVAQPSKKTYQVVKFDNTKEGFTLLLSQLPKGGHCVMEAGPQMQASGQQVWPVLLPISHFSPRTPSPRFSCKSISD